MTEPEMTDEDIRKTLNISNATNLMLLTAAANEVVRAKRNHAWICSGEGRARFPEGTWLIEQHKAMVELFKTIDELAKVVGDPES